MHVHAEKLLREQGGVVATWQLRRAGLSEKEARTAVRGLRKLHDGVFLAGFAEPTPPHRWLAATLTTPTSVLSHFSAGHCLGFRPNPGSAESITRPGSGGRRQIGRLLVFHSMLPSDDVTSHHDIPITTPERTIIDLAPHLNDKQRRKMLREALRMGAITVRSLEVALARHRGRRGTAALAKLAAFYRDLQLERCKSDAEAYAMEILHTHKRPLPEVNAIQPGGGEADLSWPDRKLIIEIDGPQFHRDKLHDAHKRAGWVAEGYTVRRIRSDDVFLRPELLLQMSGSE
jgi:Protein of unknown function (DUF559)